MMIHIITGVVLCKQNKGNYVLFLNKDKFHINYVYKNISSLDKLKIITEIFFFRFITTVYHLTYLDKNNLWRRKSLSCPMSSHTPSLWPRLDQWGPSVWWACCLLKTSPLIAGPWSQEAFSLQIYGSQISVFYRGSF